MNRMLSGANEYTMGSVNQRNGKYWFSEGAMSFFNTLIVSDSNHIGLFITGDRPDTNVDHLYSVRSIDKEGNVNTVSRFYKMSREDAFAFRKKITSVIGDMDIAGIDSFGNDIEVSLVDNSIIKLDIDTLEIK